MTVFYRLVISGWIHCLSSAKIQPHSRGTQPPCCAATVCMSGLYLRTGRDGRNFPRTETGYCAVMEQPLLITALQEYGGLAILSSSLSVSVSVYPVRIDTPPPITQPTGAASQTLTDRSASASFPPTQVSPPYDFRLSSNDCIGQWGLQKLRPGEAVRTKFPFSP